MPCSHPDIRQFDGVRCCLACGEAVFEAAALVADEGIDQTLRNYDYVDLNPALGLQIRLVVVQPGQHLEPIVCEILHANLEDTPEYEAVSYTWATEGGDVQKSRRIRCLDGSFIDVTINCEAALRNLRKPGLKRRLWVDAVCINQSCVEERNHQVGLMDRIYSTAARVLICIQDRHSSYFDLFEWLRMENDTPPSKMGEMPLTIMARKLLSSRYFRRVWVIQEVALARAAFLHVNADSVLLSRKVLHRLWDLCALDNVTVPEILLRVPGEHVQSNLLDWLVATIQCESTDSQDKVYAVMSLLDPQTRALIPIDYSLGPQQVYANALAAIIRVRHDLSILSYVRQYELNSTRTTDALSLQHFQRYLVQTTTLTSANRAKEKDLGYVQPIIQFDGESKGPWRSAVRVQETRNFFSETLTEELASPSVLVEIVTQSPQAPRVTILPRMRVRAHFIDVIGHQPTPNFESAAQFGEIGNDMVDNSYGDEETEYFNNPMDGHDAALPFGAIGTDTVHNSYGASDNAETEYPHHPMDIHNPKLRARALQLFRYFVKDHDSGTTFRFNLEDLREFLDKASRTGYQEKIFETTYSIGIALLGFREGDEIWAIDGVRAPLILRKTGWLRYRVVMECHLWAALELDCWNPGSKKGLWGADVDPIAHREQTHFIDLH